MRSRFGDTIEIFRSRMIVVRQAAGYNSDSIVITFSNYTKTPSLQNEGFGENFLRSLRCDAFHVVSGGNDWFQYPEMDEVVRILLLHLQNYKRVIVYGSSMGAYGALYFGSGLGADRIIAISPQVTIDRKFVPFETRWKEEATRIVFFANSTVKNLSERAEIYVLYDPNDLDYEHIKELRKVCRHLLEVPVPFAGHGAASFFRECSVIKELFGELILGTLTPIDIARIRRNVRIKSALYWRQMALYFLDKRAHTRAVSAARRSHLLNKSDIYNLQIFATSLRRNGDWREAVFILQELQKVNPADAKLPNLIKDASVRAGLIDQ